MTGKLIYLTIILYNLLTACPYSATMRTTEVVIDLGRSNHNAVRSIMIASHITRRWLQSQPAYRIVSDFPYYRVGTDGSVWSRKTHSGGVRDEWHKLACARNCDGYRHVILCHDGVRWDVHVSRLVLTVFRGPPTFGKNNACHNDGTRDNDHVNNLRWDSDRGNAADKIKDGTHNRGERHGMSILTKDNVLDIRRRRANGESGLSLAAEYDVSPVTISAIYTRRIWRWLPEN